MFQNLFVFYVPTYLVPVTRSFAGCLLFARTWHSRALAVTMLVTMGHDWLCSWRKGHQIINIIQQSTKVFGKYICAAACLTKWGWADASNFFMSFFPLQTPCLPLKNRHRCLLKDHVQVDKARKRMLIPPKCISYSSVHRTVGVREDCKIFRAAWRTIII